MGLRDWQKRFVTREQSRQEQVLRRGQAFLGMTPRPSEKSPVAGRSLLSIRTKG